MRGENQAGPLFTIVSYVDAWMIVLEFDQCIFTSLYLNDCIFIQPVVSCSCKHDCFDIFSKRTRRSGASEGAKPLDVFCDQPLFIGYIF